MASKCLRCDGEGYLTLWGTPREDVVCGDCQGHGVVRSPFNPEGGGKGDTDGD